MTISAKPPPPPARRRRPDTRGYWLGAIVAALATFGALTWALLALLGWQTHVEEFPRLASTGTAAITVTDAGTRVVYLEHDRAIAVPSVPAVTVTGPSGADVPLTAYRAELRYDVPSFADRIGDAVLTFPVEEPGQYRVTVTDTVPGITLAVGDNLVQGWGAQVVGSVSLLFGGLLLGLILVIVTAARRARTSL